MKPPPLQICNLGLHVTSSAPQWQQQQADNTMHTLFTPARSVYYDFIKKIKNDAIFLNITKIRNKSMA